MGDEEKGQINEAIISRLRKGEDVDDAEIEAGIDRANAWWAIAKAKCGDWKDLANRVRSGINLSPEECAFVADIIEGRIKRKNHRNVSFEISSRQWMIAFYVVWSETQDVDTLVTAAVQGIPPVAAIKATARRFPTESAVAAAMQQFNVSRSSVYKALSKYREAGEKMKDELLQFKVAPQVISLFLKLQGRESRQKGSVPLSPT